MLDQYIPSLHDQEEQYQQRLVETKTTTIIVTSIFTPETNLVEALERIAACQLNLV